MEVNALEFWKKEFGEKKSAYDFAGRRMDRSQYDTTSEFHWNIDHILPLCKNGKDIEINMQIVNKQTNEVKADKTTFIFDDKTYQVKRTKSESTTNDLYNYSNKKYCIVLMEKR